jgi:hypothetical protein
MAKTVSPLLTRRLGAYKFSALDKSKARAGAFRGTSRMPHKPLPKAF